MGIAHQILLVGGAHPTWKRIEKHQSVGSLFFAGIKRLKIHPHAGMTSKDTKLFDKKKDSRPFLCS